MRFDVFTLFPDYFSGPLSTSILKRAREAGLIEVELHDIRDATTDKWRVVDDTPFGGGAGMVMKAEVVARSLENVLKFDVGVSAPPCPVVYLTPQGRTLNQSLVEELATFPRLALLCGHYEGIDERVIDAIAPIEVSLGDFVLTGGEGAAAILIEAVARFVPGVLGNENSASGDSFATGLLEAPHYTRPAQWRGREVPDILLSGHHANIEAWRLEEALRRTAKRRPDLLDEWGTRTMSKGERKIWERVQSERQPEDTTETTVPGAPKNIGEHKEDESGLNSLG